MEVNPMGLSNNGEAEDEERIQPELYISTFDPIHNYHEEDDSDTSSSEGESEWEPSPVFDEKEYAAFKNSIKIKRGRAIGLDFKPNGDLMPNRQLAYLLKNCKLVLHGPYYRYIKNLTAPLKEEYFCPSLQSVPLRLCGVKFSSNGRVLVDEAFPTFALGQSNHRNANHKHHGRPSVKSLQSLGLKFDSNGVIICNPKFQTMLEAGEIIADGFQKQQVLRKPRNLNKNPSQQKAMKPRRPQVFFVSRPTTKMLYNFERNAEIKARLKGELSKPNILDILIEDEGEELRYNTSAERVYPFELEAIGMNRFPISVEDLIFANEDGKKQQSSYIKAFHDDMVASTNELQLGFSGEDKRPSFGNGKQHHLTISNAEIPAFFAQNNLHPQRQPDMDDDSSHPYYLEIASPKEVSDLKLAFEAILNKCGPRDKSRSLPIKTRASSAKKIHLSDWAPIQYTYIPSDECRDDLRRFNKLVCRVNELAVKVFDIFPTNWIDDSANGYCIPLLFRCFFRIKLVA